ncbi:MAG: DNA-binding protein [Pseudomonadota bacterium]
MSNPSNIEINLDLVWGVRAITRELGLESERKVFYLLEQGRIPAKKVGAQWVTSRHAIRKYFADLLPGEAA